MKLRPRVCLSISLTYCYQLVNVITLGDHIKRLSLYNLVYQIGKEDEVESLGGFYCIVKPVLTATSKQRPPVNNRPGLFWYQILLRNLYRATTYAQRPLIWGPKGGRCRQVWLYYHFYLIRKEDVIESLHFYFDIVHLLIVINWLM